MKLYLEGFAVIMLMMTALWVISVFLKNVSIVDAFWGFGFVLVNAFYFSKGGGLDTRQMILLILVSIWGLRLSFYLAWRNFGKPEDFRYQEFRRKYGPQRYWWFSFFQTFLLQGVLMCLIASPLWAANTLGANSEIAWLDYLGILLWFVGLFFESVGDYQLSKFKADETNKGKLLKHGLWRYTRHPNYFGDACVWWGFGCFALSVGGYFAFVGSLFMTLIIIKVSGVALLEKTLKSSKPGYEEYVRVTNSFIPWLPRK